MAAEHLVWRELTAEEKHILEVGHDDSNRNMKDQICFEKQRMIIPRTYLKFMDDMYNFPVKKDDIWIVTYPKCGTTWMQETVSMLINNVDQEYGKLPQIFRSPFLDIDTLMDGNEKGEGLQVPEDTPDFMKKMMEEFSKGVIPFARKMSGRRVLKSHMSFDFLPPNLEDKCKVVYVARQPKDCIVSFYHHSINMPLHGYQQSLSTFAEEMMKGVVLFGDYWKHLESGWKLRNHPNVKFIWFEDMKKDSKKVIEELSVFLEHPLSEEKVDQLVHHVSFDVMKLNKTANPSAMMKLPEEKNFMRKGQVGDWKNYFSGPELEKIDNWIEENKKRTGIQLPE
ncbi:sulfotransferase 1C3 [Eurytemora carolleeae]|uniref:sulfotransferase 1C3 n=1 Tax=Eurytemora carolleeae TaxID=1294199 RepID=UPI000C759ABE|nr:sulfotransferase 1C3 [Eurytemora carolleeae]|eukprot:XP_023322586.1 sulfotransferase 1C3-like [Eurytemora affinis]